jgi:hypothetical protein
VADGLNVSRIGQSQSQGARHCAGPPSPRDHPAAHCLVERIKHLVPFGLVQTGGNPPNQPDSTVGFYPLASDTIAHNSRPIMSVQYTDRIAGTNTVKWVSPSLTLSGVVRLAGGNCSTPGRSS